MRPLLPLAVALLLLAGCGNSPLNARTGGRIAVTGTQAHLGEYDPSRVVVRFKSSGDRTAASALTGKLGLATVKELPGLNAAVFSAASGDATGLLGALRADAHVAYAEPDYIIRLSDPKPKAKKLVNPLKQLLDLGDPDRLRQWAIPKLNAPAAWEITSGSPDVIVAVIDTGVDLNHPDLRANLVPGTTCFPEQGGPIDNFGHGSHVSGIIAGVANNGIGIVGVAPHCKIMPVKVMGPTGEGGKVEDVAAGLVWAADHGAKIANLSLGDEGTSNLLRDAVAYAERKDVLVVAAAGNFNPEKNTTTHTLDFPAGYPGVMAVGATDENDELADFSFWGSWVSVVAPGVDIFSTVPGVGDDDTHNGNYELEDGTSMATPYVAGVAALVRSRFPQMTAVQVRARLESTAVDLGAPGFDDHYGHGRIDALAAVSGG